MRYSLTKPAVLTDVLLHKQHFLWGDQMKCKLSAKTVLLYVCYVALAVASGGVFDGALTFGAYVGAMYSFNVIIASAIYVLSSIVYGWTSLMHAAVRMAVMILFWLLHRLIKRKIGKFNLLLYLLLANVFYLAFGFDGFFNFFDKVLYTCLGVAFSYVCIYVFRAVFVRGLAYRPALDETICMAIFIVAFSYCLSCLTIWNLQLIYFVAPFAILFCVASFGDKTALICAVLIGLGNIFATGGYECCVFCVVSALSAVAFCKINRYVAAISVVLVDVIMSYFLNLHGMFTTLVFAPTFVSTLVFVVIPTSVYNFVRDYSCGNAERYLGKSVAKKIGDDLSRRLLRLSDIFLSMKNAFFSMSCGHITAQEAEKAIVKQCNERICANCEQRSKCWRQDIKRTEESLLQLSTCAVQRGKCTILDVPQTLSVKCDKVSGVIAEVNAQAQMYRSYIERTEESDNGKALLGEQMGGVSGLLMQLANDCKGKTNYDKDKEQEVIERLVFHNVLCVGASIVQRSNALTVVVTVAKKDVDTAAIEKVVGGVVKQTMVTERVENTDSPSWQNVYLAVKPRFEISFGVGAVAKGGSEISGDTHTVIKTDNGKCLVALCDGMGSGKQAEQMSATSISLVESFYRAGFDSDVILSCVNNLLTSSGNEVFCAVDMVAIDLYNGLADFIKLGATVGLIKCGEQIEIVSGSSLPLGVLEEMKPSVTKKALNSGDIAVLISDGVADCFNDPNALAQVFAEVSHNVPQSIAEVILTKALKLCNNKPADDMTIVVAKVV